MALVSCTECNNEISDKADSCPRCGAPTKVLSQPSPRQEDQVFFNERGVLVTGSRFVLPGNRTFAMSGVTAVRSHHTTPSKLVPILLCLLGVVAFATTGMNIWAGLIPIALGVLLLVLRKPTYYIVLSTASGETQALKDKSRAWIEEIVAALTDCIIYRS